MTLSIFDQAWDVAKAPVYPIDNNEDWQDDPSPFLYSDEGRYEYFMPPFIESRRTSNPDYNPRAWESKHFDAQGYANYMDEEDDPELGPYIQLILFQMANEAQGKGLSRDRLMEMVRELKEYDSDVPIRVTNVESDTADYWNKLVDEGIVDSASQKPWVATTPAGVVIPKIDRAENTKKD